MDTPTREDNSTDSFGRLTGRDRKRPLARRIKLSSKYVCLRLHSAPVTLSVETRLAWHRFGQWGLV
jgi:hypothetical protein